MAYVREDASPMRSACKGQSSVGRRLFRLSIIAMTLLSAGCASIPFLGSSKEQTLRKQVEADSFPTAQQAGVYKK